MPQSLSKVYVHIIFSTKNRQDLQGGPVLLLMPFQGKMPVKMRIEPQYSLMRLNMDVEWIHIIAYFKNYMLKMNAIAQTGIPDKVC
jgi:hypothetical protein